jgi:hypothetical protein
MVPYQISIYPDDRPNKTQYRDPDQDPCLYDVLSTDNQVDYNIEVRKGDEVNIKMGDFIVDCSLPFSLCRENKVIGEYHPDSFSPIPLVIIRSQKRLIPIFSGESIIFRMRMVKFDLRTKLADLGYSYFFPGGHFFSSFYIEKNKGKKDDEAHYKNKDGNKVVNLDPCFQ